MNVLQPPNALFFIGLVVYFWIRHVFMNRTKTEKKIVRRIDGVEKLLLGMMLSAVLLLPLLYLFTPILSFGDYYLPWSVRWAGSAIMVASLWLFWRSHVDLGQNWSVSLEIRENHELITNGVYRSVRHPMYTSIWLWSIAQGMMLENWLAGWTILPVFAAMYLIRISREERLMFETFGESYLQYSAQTGRVLPRLTKEA